VYIRLIGTIHNCMQDVVNIIVSMYRCEGCGVHSINRQARREGGAGGSTAQGPGEF